jgi:hypothetical protein
MGVEELFKEPLLYRGMYTVQSIHRVGRVLSFFSSRWNWDSPDPSPARECAPHRVHRVETAAFWRTFSDEGKISPSW